MGTPFTRSEFLNVFRRLAGLVLLTGLAASAFAQDTGRGRLLYETYCGVCHYERVHERLRTKIKSLSDLRDMVARWAPQTKHKFSLDEIEDVVQYLNESHYRIGLPGTGRPPRAPSM